MYAPCYFVVDFFSFNFTRVSSMTKNLKIYSKKYTLPSVEVKWTSGEIGIEADSNGPFWPIIYLIMPIIWLISIKFRQTRNFHWSNSRKYELSHIQSRSRAPSLCIRLHTNIKIIIILKRIWTPWTLYYYNIREKYNIYV